MVTAVRKPMPRIAWSAASSSAWGALRGTPHERGLEALHSLGRLAHDRVIVLEHCSVGGPFEGKLGQPGIVGTAPGPHPDRRVNGSAQKELTQPVLGAQQVCLGVIASPDQVAKSLVGLVGYPDRREVPAAQQPGQLGRIASVGLDPVAGLDGDQRGRDDHACDAHGSQLTMEGVAGWTGFIGDTDLNLCSPKSLEELADS
jgi:hypothetical protein